MTEYYKIVYCGIVVREIRVVDNDYSYLFSQLNKYKDVAEANLQPERYMELAEAEKKKVKQAIFELIDRIIYAKQFYKET